MLAAPAFAAAALGGRREVIFPVGRRVLLFTEIAAAAGSAAIGRPVHGLAEAGLSRVLAWAPAGGDWTWDRGPHRIRPDDRIAIDATRSGLARLLRATKAGVVSPPPPAQREVVQAPFRPRITCGRADDLHRLVEPVGTRPRSSAATRPRPWVCGGQVQ
jgi:hypothetical protein